MVQSVRLAKMAATTATRGRVALKVAGAEAVEIKATIDDEKMRKGMKHLGLNPKQAAHRYVYFFDTPRLDLFNAGVIVRARRITGDQHDTTIKIRPVRTGQLPSKWQRQKGFKIEADWGHDQVVLSASLSRPVGKGMIKEVAAGNKPLKHIFDADQERFLAEMCQIKFNLDKLKLFGPVTVLWWKLQHPGVPSPLTAELWMREDKQALLETSVKVPAAQAAFANAGFFAFLAEVGAEREHAEQAKTRWVLEHHARELRGAQAKKPASMAKQVRRKSSAARPGSMAAEHTERTASAGRKRVAKPTPETGKRTGSKSGAGRAKVASEPASPASPPASPVVN